MRFLFIFILIFPLCAFALNDGGKAQFQKSLTLFQKRKFKQSRDIQAALVKSYPENSLYWFNLGTSHYMAEEFKSARKAFLKVENLESPLAPAAKLYRAKSELALKNRKDATRLLKELLIAGTLPPHMRAQAEMDYKILSPELAERHNRILDLYHAGKFQQALDVIDKISSPDIDTQLLRGLLLVRMEKPEEAHRVLASLPDEVADPQRLSLLQYLIDQTKRGEYSRRPYWAYLESGFGYNSNSYYDTPNDGSYEALFLKNRWGTGVRALNHGSLALYGGYSGQWEEVANAGDLKVVSHMFQLNGNYDSPTHFVQVSPFFQYDEWAGIPSQVRSGTKLKLRKLWTQSVVGLETDLISITGKLARFSYLSGSEFVARLYYGSDTKNRYSQFYLEYQKVKVGDYTFRDGSVLPLAYEAVGPGARVMWKLDPMWLLTLNAYIKRKNYFALSLPGLRKRNDREIGVSIRGTRVWKENLSAYGMLSFIKNNSSLGPNNVHDENYESAALTVGLMWDIL